MVTGAVIALELPVEQERRLWELLNRRAKAWVRHVHKAELVNAAERANTKN